jgi:DNA relaxase NicK
MMMNKSHMYFVDLCLLTQFTVSSRSKEEVTVRFQKDVKSELSRAQAKVGKWVSFLLCSFPKLHNTDESFNLYNNTQAGLPGEPSVAWICVLFCVQSLGILYYYEAGLTKPN